jgi:hypothetical protein
MFPDIAAITTRLLALLLCCMCCMFLQWGKSLRQGADEAWAPYLASTYQVANLQVAKPVSSCLIVTIKLIAFLLCLSLLFCCAAPGADTWDPTSMSAWFCHRC